MIVPGREAGKIRLLVVDDSTTVRAIIRGMIEGEADIEIVGEAVNGIEAVEMTRRLRPGIILMDIRMPMMDGYEATEQIMAACATPIIVFSSLTRAEEARVSIAMLALGALDVMSKPNLSDPASVEECAKVLRRKIRAASGVVVVRRITRKVQVPARAADPPKHLAPPRYELLGIGSSTGGPAVLREILSRIPASYPLPVLLVQHITPGFSAGFIDWLQQYTELLLRVASPRDRAVPGTVLMAPDGRQMEVRPDGTVDAVSREVRGVHIPSVDVLFSTMADAFRNRSIGVILTGMGADGVEGLLKIRQAGGMTIAQDEPSCTVYGMPGEAVRRGAAAEILTPERISGYLNELAGAPPAPGRNSG